MKNKQIIVSNFFGYIICFIIASSIGCAIFSMLFEPIIYLNKNQILYIFSSAPQIVAGLYGLTLAGYIFMESKLNDSAKENDTLYDQIEALKIDYYNIIKLIGLLCILSIMLSLLNIGTYEFLAKKERLYTYMINQAIIFFAFEVLLIVLFSCIVINPHNITEISNRLRTVVEKHLKGEKEKEEVKGDITEFLKYYNLLEEMIISFASELVELKNYICIDWKQRRGYQPNIIQSLKMLHSHELINGSLYSEINEIRQYRNYIVHGTDFWVDYGICERLKEIFNALKYVYDARDDKEKRIKAVTELYKISK